MPKCGTAGQSCLPSWGALGHDLSCELVDHAATRHLHTRGLGLVEHRPGQPGGIARPHLVHLGVDGVDDIALLVDGGVERAVVLELATEVLRRDSAADRDNACGARGRATGLGCTVVPVGRARCAAQEHEKNTNAYKRFHIHRSQNLRAN